jgi:hypothetical protein
LSESLYFWTSKFKLYISMAILRMQTTVSPISGASVVGGSALVAYDSAQIVWPSLASKVGTTASSIFTYQNFNGTIGEARVKASVAGILAAVSASTLAG